ncbi:porphobilinogen synthase [Lentilitoribacter sp. Alg239-R112]|uniref:porphobilinogen synthase n=1 Tax=Lentilitoribacter sp. Alg239-R112 TaxID=2305987 RepID=UPI0013A6D010|nr:porphobilinogen synthase [Lentilitoribacter sp. Alg239-R112]
MSDITKKIDLVTGNRRMRRYRGSEWMRSMVQETHLSAADLIWPIFVIEGENKTENIEAMPGVERMSVDRAVEAAKLARNLGIPAIATFPNIDYTKRDKTGSEILNPDNLINQTTRAIKAAVPEIGIITDVALDPFTSDGHDGIFEDGEIVNDKTVEVLAKAAILQAQAGSDIIAPSEMMDGRIGIIRQALDGAGYQSVAIMSYAAKFVSGFYGPYREAIGTSNFLKGDKNSYFLNPANPNEAIRDAALDVQEGADMMMVKPGLPYLDMCLRVKEEFGLPTFAYQVSGEYAMIKAAAQNGWLDEERAMMESLMAFKRAGCDGILTYFAPRAAEILNTTK